MPDRAAAVTRRGCRHQPGGDGRRGTARRAACRARDVPGVAGRAVGMQRQLRHRRDAEDQASGAAQRTDQLASRAAGSSADGVPWPVAIPATAMLFLTATGTPSRGRSSPSLRAWSAAAASSSTASRRSSTKACSCGSSASIRAEQLADQLDARQRAAAQPLRKTRDPGVADRVNGTCRAWPRFSCRPSADGFGLQARRQLAACAYPGRGGGALDQQPDQPDHHAGQRRPEDGLAQRNLRRARVLRRCLADARLVRADRHLYAPPVAHTPVKQCSRWNRLVDRAAALQHATSPK